MEQVLNFKCTGENLEQIPEEIAINKGLSFPKAHTNKNDMALLADEIRKHKKDSICRIPFCVTVEAEAMGARINLGNEKTGPIVENYLFSSVEELAYLEEIDLDKGRMSEVLGSVELLSQENKIVALSVEGPFTIASALIEPTILFKALRKDRETVKKFFNVIENSIVKYILKGIEKGASIISYSDPVGSMDIVGPRVYQELSGPISFNILKRVERHLKGSLVHVCGKTSTALEKLGVVESKALNVKEAVRYGEALCTLQTEGNSKYIGHACIKKSPYIMVTPIVWSLGFK